MNTPEIVHSLKTNEIFVYGSNQFAQHGAGSAKAALDFGAKYGDTPIGLRGQTYGIITKSFSAEPVTLDFIASQVLTLYMFARLRPELTFLVTKIGTNLAGFTIQEIGDLFHKVSDIKPSNIILPKEFES